MSRAHEDTEQDLPAVDAAALAASARTGRNADGQHAYGEDAAADAAADAADEDEFEGYAAADEDEDLDDDAEPDALRENAVPARRRLTPSGLRVPPQLRLQREDVTRWWQTQGRSELDKALRSERYFWAKFGVLLALAVLFAAAGVRRVQLSSAGLQTAYDLVQVSHQLRDRRERNRALEARITGLKNPVDLRREGYERYDMHAPAPEDQVLVGDREPPADAPTETPSE